MSVVALQALTDHNNSSQCSYAIGLMSGTSLDGVDGVLAQLNELGQPSLLARASRPLPPELRAELLELNRPTHDELHRAALAANAVSDCYADVVNQLLQDTGLSASQIAALGAHGQTVRHRPELGYTTQLLAPARLAERTGISVIADFRSRDVAAGGQGAPLVPAFHRAMFGTSTERVILNLGGIANVTLLRANTPVIGFDTGPANMLLDLWCERHTGAPFDNQGQWAASGIVNPPLLNHLLRSEPWFELPAPKSTGRDLFNSTWLDARLSGFGDLLAVDVQATLTALTVAAVTEALERAGVDHTPIYLCGGGAHNAYLLELLGKRWKASVQTTEALGIATQDVEALAFAWLAWAHLNKNAGNLPEVTGAVGARILGACWPA
jgi:anhydro-N-acetylmuramic acid kinase